MAPFANQMQPSGRTGVEKFLTKQSETTVDVSGGDRMKCVLVGDGAVGKTSLVVSYTTNGYPTEYVPTAFDNYNVRVTVDNNPICVQLCDTAGQDDFDALRPLCYPGTDVFLLCFSVVSPTSFYNLRDKWLPEIRYHCPAAPVILVGTQCDLRSDVKVLIELASYREQPVSETQAKRMAQLVGAESYLESSALTQKNLKEVFDTAIMVGLKKGYHHQLDKRKSNNYSSVFNNNNHDNNNSTFKSFGKQNSELSNCDHGIDNEDCIHYDKKPERKGGWKKWCCLG